MNKTQIQMQVQGLFSLADKLRTNQLEINQLIASLSTVEIKSAENTIENLNKLLKEIDKHIESLEEIKFKFVMVTLNDLATRSNANPSIESVLSELSSFIKPISAKSSEVSEQLGDFQL